MKTVSVRIEGITPLLMHRFAVEVCLDPKLSKSKKKDQKKTEDDVESYLYMNEDGKLVQPATHIIGALKRAGTKFQITGQGKLTYKNLLGSGAVIINPDMILHETQKWEIDRRAVIVNQSRIIRERPMLSKWALSFDMEIDDDEIPVHTAHEILGYAGKRVGIGDYRPDRGGPFGRFMITKFE